MNNDINDKKMEQEGLLGLLRFVRANQENHMRQQWTSSYYVLLLYAGIVGIQNYTKIRNEYLFIILAILAGLVCYGGIYIIKKLEDSIRLNRNISDEIYENFKTAKSILERQRNEMKIKDRVSLRIFFHSVNIIGCFLALFVLIVCSDISTNMRQVLMNITPNMLNSTGLILDIFGAVLIFIFGLPAKIDRDGAILLKAEQTDEAEKKKAKNYDIKSKIGLILLITGFTLQLISNLFK